MARMEGPAGRRDLRANLPSTRGSGSLLEVDAWIPSEVRAISPLVERLMRLIEGSHCVAGEEDAVQLALREALNNAVVHGNRLDAHKLVHVRCRCKVGAGISLIVSDQGQGFDPSAVPDPLSADNLESEHGRGIHLMTLAMDEVSFELRGTEVHMCKRLARNERAGVRIKQRRPCRRFSVVTYALAAFRYLATGIVALLLVLLIVELGAAIGAVPEQDIPTSGNREGVIGASPEAKAFFGRGELRSASYMPELTLDWQLPSPVRQRAQLSPPPASSFGSNVDTNQQPRVPTSPSGPRPKGRPVVVERNPLEGEKTVRPQDLKTNTQNTPRIIFRSDVPEEGVKNGPTPAEIRHRAFEIHIERGGIHGCDLDDWLQAERDLQEKYNKSNDGGPKKK